MGGGGGSLGGERRDSIPRGMSISWRVGGLLLLLLLVVVVLLLLLVVVLLFLLLLLGSS